MAIPASRIVNVMPRVITGGSADLELNGLLLTDNELISASTMVLSFSSASTVGTYFGIGSVEYQSAERYFTSYNNKLTAPKAFYVARRIAKDAAAWLRGGKVTQSIAQLKAVTNGEMAIIINNTACLVSNVDFSAAASYSDMAAILQGSIAAQVSGTTVKYSSLTGAFTITSPTSGEDSAISYAAPVDSGNGADLSALLNLTEATGAIVSEGMAALGVDEQMAAILSITQNFVSFTTAWEVDVEEFKEWAAWANTHYGWLYVPYTTSLTAASPDSKADMGSAQQADKYDHIVDPVYGTLDYAVFIMGIVASVAWQRVNGTITAAFKRQSGLAPYVADEATAAVLEAKGYNYFGNYATRNAEFVFLYPGSMSSSDYGFIDPYINSVWLNNRLQVALMDGITSAGRVPYNERGYTMIAAWMMDPINEALNNAAIEPGVTLSERQKSELMNEAGLDISEELWTQGYYIQVLDPGASVRAKRDSPIVSLWYTYGGAVQRIEVANSAVL